MKIPETVTNIGNEAFANNYITGLTLDSNLQTIGTSAFANNQITGMLTIPDSVTSIGQTAFLIIKLSTLTLGKGLSGKSIANAAFAQNEINKVINHSKVDSLNYLGGQQA